MIDNQERIIEKKSFFSRLAFIYSLFAILFIFFLYRTYTLQISSFEDYEEASFQNKTREILIQPRRGLILDRKKEALVENVPSYDLITFPSEIIDLNLYVKNINEIVSLTNAEETYFRENFDAKARFNRELRIKRNLTKEEIAKFEVRKYKFPNTFIEERFQRETKYDFIFSHSIGYIGGASDEYLQKGFNKSLNQETVYLYSNGHIEGKTGLEKIYDSSLRGNYGKKLIEVDASGKFLSEQVIEAPINGKNILTSLDIESHKVAYKALNNRRGAVVAVEIESGNIVTYVSSPSFSINKMANGLSVKEFNSLKDNANKPFFDRVVQGRYSPASTIKPAIGLFGLEEEIIDWKFEIDDPGFFILPEDKRVYRGWKKGGHGRIGLKDAIIESSNTFFFSLAYESDIDDLIMHLKNFGFGRNICNDCFMPDIGLLPNPEWKMNNLNFGWFKGDTVNLGVGQGYLSVTPIQLAYYSAFIANKGALNEFSLSQNIPKNITFNWDNKIVNDDDWEKIHQSMIGVIDDPKGTAKKLKNLKKYTIAAKSGTVELVSTQTKEDYKIIRENEGKRDHAIIIAFGPMPNPKYAVSVVIENGESGGSVAGPVAIKVLNSLIENEKES